VDEDIAVDEEFLIVQLNCYVTRRHVEEEIEEA
jgi:hypothetical protein